MLNNLLNCCLKENKLNKLRKEKYKNKDVYIVISYHQLIQSGGLLPFLIPLAVATGKAALTSGAAALGPYAGNKIGDKITDSLDTNGYE